jgi:F0F1-type ATP synthase assembly protein I
MTGTDEDNEARGPVGNPGRTGVSGAEFAGAGLQFAAILVLSAFAGMWADRKLGTSPWLLIVLVFAGAAAGFYSLYRKLMKGKRLGDRRRHQERRDDRE